MRPFVPPTTAPWATYVFCRSHGPDFKVHASEANARRAPRHSQIWEWVDGQGWVERERKRR